jgi:hypothetical protein
VLALEVSREMTMKYLTSREITKCFYAEFMHCFLFFVVCPLSVVRCPLSVVRCPLSVVRCPCVWSAKPNQDPWFETSRQTSCKTHFLSQSFADRYLERNVFLWNQVCASNCNMTAEKITRDSCAWIDGGRPRAVGIFGI